MKRAKYRERVSWKNFALIGLAIGTLLMYLLAQISTVLGGTYNTQPLLHFVDPVEWPAWSQKPYLISNGYFMSAAYVLILTQ
jgi:hypothetical protein